MSADLSASLTLCCPNTTPPPKKKHWSHLDAAYRFVTEAKAQEIKGDHSMKP